MKALKFFLLKLYLKTGMFFYFRSIRIEGLEHIPVDKPTLILSNHRNALLDALIFAVNLPKYGYFLTRASVFKKPSISKFLKSINMIPVYRIRDGWQNLTNNNSVFQNCIDLLKQDQIVVIFPEGGHNLARRVRPLSKGFTRIVFDYIESNPEKPIQLVPVGLNFSKTTGFVDEAYVQFGKPHEIRTDYYENRHEGIKKLKAEMLFAMRELTVQIPDENYDAILEKLETEQVDFLNPKKVNACIQNGFQNCPKPENAFLNPIRNFLKLLLKISFFIPYLFWKYYVQPKIVEIEFTATFRYTVAIVLGPIYVIAIFFLVFWLWGLTAALWAISYLILLSLLTVKL